MLVVTIADSLVSINQLNFTVKINRMIGIEDGEEMVFEGRIR